MTGHRPTAVHGFIRHPRLVLASVVTLLGLALNGCGLVPPTPATPKYVSPCFRGLPEATAALHDRKAKLVGVHRLRLAKLIKRLPKELEVPGDEKLDVCAFAFKGPFTPDQVDNNQTTTGGEYAIVLVTSKSLRLVASFEVNHLPERFGRPLP